MGILWTHLALGYLPVYDVDQFMHPVLIFNESGGAEVMDSSKKRIVTPLVGPYSRLEASKLIKDRITHSRHAIVPWREDWEDGVYFGVCTVQELYTGNNKAPEWFIPDA